MQYSLSGSVYRARTESSAMQDPLTSLDTRIASYHDQLIAFLRKRVASDPEELAQEVWLRIHRAAPDLPDEAAFRAYMYTVARRLVIDRHRRQAARLELVSVDGQTLERLSQWTGGPDRDLEAREVLVVVTSTLEQMSPEMAQVFRWRVLEDVPFKVIAQRQGCPVNTALARMHRAVKKLSVALADAGLVREDP